MCFNEYVLLSKSLTSILVRTMKCPSRTYDNFLLMLTINGVCLFIACLKINDILGYGVAFNYGIVGIF